MKGKMAETKKQTVSLPRVEHYLYTVSWSEEDEAYIARVAEFSSLAAHGDSPEKALTELILVVQSVLKDLAAEDEPIPQPLSEYKYSGRLVVRMSVYLHRRLAMEAARQGLSLNQLINQRLEIPVEVPIELLTLKEKNA